MNVGGFTSPVQEGNPESDGGGGMGVGGGIGVGSDGVWAGGGAAGVGGPSTQPAAAGGAHELRHAGFHRGLLPRQRHGTPHTPSLCPRCLPAVDVASSEEAGRDQGVPTPSGRMGVPIHMLAAPAGRGSLLASPAARPPLRSLSHRAGSPSHERQVDSMGHDPCTNPAHSPATSVDGSANHTARTACRG